MKTRIAFLFALSAMLFVSMSFKKMVNPLLGKWQLNTKLEEKIQDGVVLEKSEKNYKPGKKVYEFLPEGKLIIHEDHGKSKEKKKYSQEGPDVRIGDNLYTMTFNGNNLLLSKTKSKTKEGKTTVETDELRLERIN